MPGNAQIFIVGMNGSGTTMLLDHLDNHSRIYGFPGETRILPYMLRKARRSGDLRNDKNWRALWDEMRTAFPFWKANGRASVPLPEEWREIQRNLPAIFDNLMSYFARLHGKAIWCEKTPMHALHIRSLSEAFPAAKFLHCIRDGRDSAASFHRRYGYDAKCTVYRWKRTVLSAQAQGREIADRYREVKFEQITADPESVLASICQFLGVEFEDSLTTSSRSGPRFKGIHNSTIVPNSGRFRSYFDQKAILDMEDIAGALLHRLGYDVGNSTGDRDLNATLAWARDFIVRCKLGLKEIPQRMRSRSGSPFRFLFGRILSSLKQSRTNRF